MEQLQRVKTLAGGALSDDGHPQQMVINTEWGAFGSQGALDSIRTGVDHDVDADSLNPGQQIFEKMISGMYLGELVRNVIVQCARRGAVFAGALSDVMLTKDKFETKYMSLIESETALDEITQTKRILQDELKQSDVTAQDCVNVKRICAAVSTRAAFLSACGLAALIERVGKRDVTVAMDGTLYKQHPTFHRRMDVKLRSLLSSEVKVEMKLSEDGSGVGAALVAAVTQRLATR